MNKKPYTNNISQQQQQQQSQQLNQQQIHQYRIQSNNNNSSFLNNTSGIYSTSKIAIKQANQSFYDDGLLDLIEEMNPWSNLIKWVIDYFM